MEVNGIILSLFSGYFPLGSEIAISKSMRRNARSTFLLSRLLGSHKIESRDGKDAIINS